jgi:site-specific DNA recombinase
MSASPKLRCAVYTRKSTEEGLDQEFNSLDAQHEACSAYIASQIGLGWKLVPDRYDDGGISGGTMERPALQRLLQDIRDRRIDVVVVYKIDRLTRSLMDFSKIVEVFDQHGASFVSVTQQFNTTTSMGRLTLNVLLSFAQFEREVTAERIRDKIAASKKKGMWMGGTIPFGYRIKDRKLVVESAEAAEVRKLFERYLELGSVPALARELNGKAPDDGTFQLIHTDTGQGRRRRPAKVGKGKLYYMLANPIYVGRIRHGAETYVGEHQPILGEEIFAAVQARLSDQAPTTRGSILNRDVHLLNGLIFDETGDRLSPIHAKKAGKRYRYYISSRLKDGARSKAGDGWRLPAIEIESIVLRQLKDLLTDNIMLSVWMHAAGQSFEIEAGLKRAAQQARTTEEQNSPAHIREIIHTSLRRIELAPGRMRLTFDREAITNWLIDGASQASEEELHIVELPFAIRRRGVEQRLVIEGQDAPLQRVDRSLIDMIARAHIYLDALTDGSGIGRKEVASRFRVHPEDVSRLLPVAFLSPRIVEAILTGQQPADLSVRHLTRAIDLPNSWAAQETLLAAG